MEERALANDKVAWRESVTKNEAEICGLWRNIEYLVTDDALARLQTGGQRNGFGVRCFPGALS